MCYNIAHKEGEVVCEVGTELRGQCSVWQGESAVSEVGCNFSVRRAVE